MSTCFIMKLIASPVWTHSLEMQSRAAFVWSLCAEVYGVDINVKPDGSKTALGGVQFEQVRGCRHVYRPIPPPSWHKVCLFDGRELPWVF